MNDLNDTALPDPKFVEHLEWQLRSEYRREQRLSQQPPPWWRRTGWRAAALASVSLLVGFGGATAAQATNERLQERLIEAEARLQLEMARQNLMFTEEQLALTLTRQEVGTASDEELANARLQRAMVQRELELMRLELAYQERTGERPRHDLAAPTIDGRDIVSARLELQRENLNDQLTQMAFELEQLMTRAQAGAVDEFQVMAATFAQQSLMAELDLAERLVRLRRDFLDGEITAADLEVREEFLRARAEADRSTGHLSLAQAHLDRVTRAPGMHEEIEIRAAEHQVSMAQLQAEMASLRLRLLRQRE
ncbi:MAG: hypothetical protein GKS06_19690 [Acidobacteria bacterium]|nr:hypothetical protein [Acidobacteriota bacterium]